MRLFFSCFEPEFDFFRALEIIWLLVRYIPKWFGRNSRLDIWTHCGRKGIGPTLAGLAYTLASQTERTGICRKFLIVSIRLIQLTSASDICGPGSPTYISRISLSLSWFWLSWNHCFPLPSIRINPHPISSRPCKRLSAVAMSHESPLRSFASIIRARWVA